MFLAQIKKFFFGIFRPTYALKIFIQINTIFDLLPFKTYITNLSYYITEKFTCKIFITMFLQPNISHT